MRWIFRIIGILVLFCVIAVGSLFLLPAERVARIAADQIQNLTGRDVKITGNVAMTLWPVLGATVEGLEVGNADWSEQGPMLTANNAALGIDAAALLSGEIRIKNIEAQSPTIRLESRADGRASWIFTDASGEAQIETGTTPDTAPQAFSIEKLKVTDATLIYDAEGADLVSYSGVDLDLDWPDPAGGASIDAIIRPAGAPVRVQATIDLFQSFLAGDIRPVSVTLAAAGGSVALNGRAGISGEVAGKMTTNLPDTDGYLKALGLGGAALPAGLGKSLQADGDVTLTAERRLSLRSFTAGLGGNNQISGDVDVSLNGTPNITANLNAGDLDLKALTGASSGNASGGSVGSGWSKDPIDASGLSAFNAEIALRASSVDLGSMRFGPTRTVLRNDRARMVFELREVQAYEGTLSGEFVMNNRSGLSVGGKLFGNGLQVQPLLADLADVTRLTGAANAEVQFLGVGQSIDTIMRSLSGRGALQVGRGTIEGFNLDQLMRTGNAKGGTTVFNSLGATFTMESGNLVNNDLLASLKNFETRGAGRIGLGAQDIDYTFTPTALKANDGKGLAIPVRIRGPWADPKIQPDLEAAIDLNLKEEKKKIETKVKSEIEKRVQKELGVVAEEGQSIEDAIEKKIEKKLEDEIGNRLKKLFD